MCCGVGCDLHILSPAISFVLSMSFLCSAGPPRRLPGLSRGQASGLDGSEGDVSSEQHGAGQTWLIREPDAQSEAHLALLPLAV